MKIALAYLFNPDPPKSRGIGRVVTRECPCGTGGLDLRQFDPTRSEGASDRCQASHKVSAVFDDPNLIGSAGLVPVRRLAHRAGLQDLLEQRLSVPSANAAAKAACVMAGMLAGADSIDDLELLRHGGMGRVFPDVRAPSTLGTFLRSFTFGHVRQLDAVHTRVLAGLATVVPQLLAGVDGLAFIDIDDTIREVHGYAKQGAAYGYSG